MADFLLNVLKFILAVLLIPFVIASTVAFTQHLHVYPSTYMDFFLWGILTFLLIFLFIYQCWGLYESGQKLMMQVFKFVSPFDQVIARIIPFYPIAILLLFYITTGFFKNNDYNHYFLYFAGFALAMHIVLTGQELQQAETSPIKPTYLFSMSLIYIVNVVFMVLLLDLIFGKWTLPNFCGAVIEQAMMIFVPSFNKINLVITSIKQ